MPDGSPIVNRPPNEALDAIVYAFPRLPDLAEAVLLIDKPAGCSSFTVIRRLRRILGVRKIGHAGTLDPLATGLLICLVGRATRRMTEFMEMDKEYTGVIRLGQRTASYDAETPVEEARDASGIDDAALEAARRAYLGPIEQLPPMYSAVKVGGERLYKKARRGEEVARRPRAIVIHRFELGQRAGDEIPFLVACTKGTYIRTLAHDVGEHLGVGGHLTSLRRTAIGPYRVASAWTLEALAAAFSEATHQPEQGG